MTKVGVLILLASGRAGCCRLAPRAGLLRRRFCGRTGGLLRGLVPRRSDGQWKTAKPDAQRRMAAGKRSCLIHHDSILPMRYTACQGSDVGITADSVTPARRAQEVPPALRQRRCQLQRLAGTGWANSSSRRVEKVAAQSERSGLRFAPRRCELPGVADDLLGKLPAAP